MRNPSRNRAFQQRNFTARSTSGGNRHFSKINPCLSGSGNPTPPAPSSTRRAWAFFWDQAPRRRCRTASWTPSCRWEACAGTSGTPSRTKSTARTGKDRSPNVNALIHHDGTRRAGLLAQAAQNAVGDVVVNMHLSTGGNLLGLDGIKRRLGFFEQGSRTSFRLI